MKTIHAIWIGDQLSLLEQLVIKLFQARGFQFHLWLYDECSGVPQGTVKRDASEILPRESIFRYAGKPMADISGGGIGSFAHWSDQFQYKLLYEHGGYYTQLDVLLLSDLDLPEPYAFVKAEDSFQTCFMKMPKGSEYALACYTALKETVNPATMGKISWLDSMRIAGEMLKSYELEQYLLPDIVFQNGMGFFEFKTRPGVKLVHFCNAKISPRKGTPRAGTLYGSLLREHSLWKPNLTEMGKGVLRTIIRS